MFGISILEDFEPLEVTFHAAVVLGLRPDLFIQIYSKVLWTKKLIELTYRPIKWPFPICFDLNLYRFYQEIFYISDMKYTSPLLNELSLFSFQVC